MQIYTDEAKILKLYPEAGETLAALKRTGLPWDFAVGGRIPDMTRWLQVRPEKQIAVPGTVRKYKAAYLRDDPVPPIVKTIDEMGVDGAHRTIGALEAGLSTLPAFRIKIDSSVATESQRRQMKEFAGASNNKHGMGMSRAGNNELIREAAKDGGTVKQIAADLKVPASQVSGVLAEDVGRARLRDLGIKIEGGLKPSHIQKLGFRSKQLQNPVMRAVALLIRDHGITTGEQGDLLRTLSKLYSDEEKLAAVAQAAIDFGARTRGVVKKTENYSGKLRQAVKRPLEIIGDSPDAMVEGDPRYAMEHLKLMELVHEKVGKVVAEQRAAIHAAEARENGYEVVPPPAFRGA